MDILWQLEGKKEQHWNLNFADTLLSSNESVQEHLQPENGFIYFTHNFTGFNMVYLSLLKTFLLKKNGFDASPQLGKLLFSISV